MDIQTRKNFIKELRLRKTINYDITNDFEFIKQVEHKYNIKVFIDDVLYYETKDLNPDYETVPLDISISTKTKKSQIRTSTYFSKNFFMLNNKKCEETQEVIDIKKTLNIKSCCKNEFDLLDNYIMNKFNFKIQNDDLTFDENVFLNQSYGQTNYLKSLENIDEAYCYDINTEHPFIMCNNFFFPTRQGTSKKLNDISEINHNKLGIYKVVIKYNSATKYFKAKDEQKFKVVSSYFLKTLIKTKTKFYMYDSDVNAIEYDFKDCVSGHNLFYKDFQALYALKKNGNKTASKFLHMLLGQMSKRVDKHIFVQTDDEYKQYENGNYSSFVPFRLKWFVYDSCRSHMFDNYIKYAIRHNLTIYRIKADSILIQGKLKDSQIGEHMGQMKYEGKGNNISFAHVNDKSYAQKLIL